MRKAASDLYERRPGREVYRPFVSSLIKEGKPGSAEIVGLDVWPPEVSEMFRSPVNCLKEVKGEDKEFFDDLCRRYNHLGGAQEERVEYHSRSDIQGYFHYARKEEVAKEFVVAPAAVLAVGRAKDDMLRKLIAMCPGNLLFRTLTEMFGDNPELLDLGMLGGGILGKVYAPSDEGCWAS